MLKKCNCIIVFLCILLFCGCSKIEDIDLNINKSLIETNNDDSMLEETTIIKINTNITKDMFIVDHHNIIDEEEIDGKKVLFQEAKYPEININYDNEQLNDYLIQLNSYFKKSAENFINDNKQDSREIFELRGFDDGYYSHDESITIERCSNGVLSILSNCYEYTMGAHGLTIITGYNYNITDGRNIFFDKLISDKSKLKQLIVNYLENEFKEEINDDYQETIDSFLNGEYEMKFLVTDKGIDIIFNQYDIAAYAVGIITVPIDYVGNEDIFYDILW